MMEFYYNLYSIISCVGVNREKYRSEHKGKSQNCYILVCDESFEDLHMSPNLQFNKGEYFLPIWYLEPSLELDLTHYSTGSTAANGLL